MLEFLWAKDLQKEKNINIAFRLKVNQTLSGALLRLSGANCYRVFLADRLIHYGPARAAHGCSRIDEIELNLAKGDCLTVELAGYNVNSFCFPNEGPYFAAEIISESRCAYSTGDFDCFLLADRIQKIQRYSYQRPFAESYIMKECRSLFYRGKDTFPKIYTQCVTEPVLLQRNVPYPKLTKEAPCRACEYGEVIALKDFTVWKNRSIDNAGGGNLQGFTRSQLDGCLTDEVSAFDYLPKKGVDCNGSLAAKEYFIFDLSQNLTGFIDTVIYAKQKCQIYIIFDEIDWTENASNPNAKNICFYRNECCNVIKYQLDAGEYRLINFEPLTARYIKIICFSGAIEIKSVEFIRYQNSDIASAISGGDGDLDLIIKAAQNTLAQNAVDILTDCPSRERAGWLCDAFFSGRAEWFFTGKNIVEHNFLENYALSPQPDGIPEGMIPMCYPSEVIGGEFIPNWAMWYIIELYDYFERTGDKIILEKSGQKVNGLLDYFKRFLSKEGFLENLEGCVFVEWSRANEFAYGVNVPTNILYAHMLMCAGRLYDLPECIWQGERLKTKIAEIAYNGEFFADRLTRLEERLVCTAEISETCQYYAFFFDVAGRDNYFDLLERLVYKFGPDRDVTKIYPCVCKSNAFMGNYMRLDILNAYGFYGQVLKECKSFFLPMAIRTNTLWEHDSPKASLNHGFASYAACIIDRAIKGVRKKCIKT